MQGGERLRTADGALVAAFRAYANQLTLNELLDAGSPGAALRPFLSVALRGTAECPRSGESFEAWVRRVKRSDTLRFVERALGELALRFAPARDANSRADLGRGERTELVDWRRSLPAPRKQAPHERAVDVLLSEEGDRLQRFLENAYRRVSRRDDYGDEDPAALNVEIARFLEKLIHSHSDFAPEWERRLFEVKGVACIQNGRLTGGRLAMLDGALRARFAAYRRDVSRRTATLPTRDQFREMSGSGFEVFLERFLRHSGLQVERLGASGDQGADLIVGAGALRVVIQAKNVRSNVGNKAVQEAHAARGFYRAQSACVVTTSQFTKGARELASRLDVELIEGSEIALLPKRLSRPPIAR